MKALTTKKLGTCWQVGPDNDNVSTYSELFFFISIISKNAILESFELIDQRKEKRQKIDRFFGAWHDSENMDIIFQNTVLWRKRQIEKHKRLHREPRATNKDPYSVGGK